MCVNCKQVLESTHRHDFKVCSCWGSKGKTGVSIDGGKDYQKFSYETNGTLENMSEYEEVES